MKYIYLILTLYWIGLLIGFIFGGAVLDKFIIGAALVNSVLLFFTWTAEEWNKSR